jgi:hypothetical protein
LVSVWKTSSFGSGTEAELGGAVFISLVNTKCKNVSRSQQSFFSTTTALRLICTKGHVIETTKKEEEITPDGKKKADPRNPCFL